MVDDERLATLEERQASTAARIAVLEARWQDLSERYVAWRDDGVEDDALSIVEDREFPDAYAVLRAQYDVDLELFALLQAKRHLEDEIALLRSMHDLEGEIMVLRSQPANDVYVIPAPVLAPTRDRRQSKQVGRIAVIAFGFIALLVATYALTRGSGETPTVEVGVPAQQAAPIKWRVIDPKVEKQRGGCRKSTKVTAGTGAEYAGKVLLVRIDGPDFKTADDRRTRLNQNGVAKISYDTGTCAGSPANSVHVLQVGDDVNVASKRSR
jgi:hypothetical protein